MVIAGIVSVLLVLPLVAAETAPIVAVTGGRIRGARLGQGGAVFKGVPYARPPVGPLRWREPARVERWAGVRDANGFGPPCAQNSYFATNNRETSKEDCLYLNIWTPALPASPNIRGRKLKPVMVWIHGGGDFAGDANENGRGGGEKLMAHDVVVVTLSYRLGLFGFFAHPELTRESSHHASGNQGILDQIEALRWVKANIARFGGDPGNVTIFGESAGSFNVSVLMTSPLSRGLFRRAVAQSGSVILLGAPLSLSDSEKRGVSLAASWGAGAVPPLQTLRDLPVAQILKSEPDFLRSPAPNLGLTVDGYVFPQRPTDVFAEGKQHRVDMLLGNLAHEWVPGVGPPQDLTQTIERTYTADHAGQALTLYTASAADPLYGSPAEQWAEDTGFRCSGVTQLIWHTAAGNRAFEFQMDHAPPFNLRNTHSQDVAYVFGTVDGPEYKAADHALSEVMQKYWTNFAKTGNPNGPGLPVWPPFDPVARAYLAFGDGSPVAKEGLRRPFCDLFTENIKRQMTNRH